MISEELTEPAIRLLATLISQIITDPTGEIFIFKIQNRHPPPTLHAQKPETVAAIGAGGPIEIDFLGYLLPAPIILNGYLTSGFYLISA
jgi:hypothetical protein